MKTLKLTEQELATLKAVLFTEIQRVKKEKAAGANVDDLLEQYKKAFEALSFAQ
ncbi:hypothetical protein [Anoxybacillus sp. ST4]|uniref:hypothetical protein n=1 Tax=Anoxybacillus sp. ST4 TaxID=2864181 RepID=UPI001C641B0B|nr:hypothetical protein [Anoxybacillus sp. ST4]MBW7649816.1 hypothetical protein [Anoxybacillus sp. ST4]